MGGLRQKHILLQLQGWKSEVKVLVRSRLASAAASLLRLLMGVFLPCPHVFVSTFPRERTPGGLN